MQISLSSGGYNILNSGEIFLFEEEGDLKIDLIADNGFEFSVVLRFSKDDSNQEKMEKSIVDNAIILSCINFKDVGTGLLSPANIATIDDKKIYLLFWSYLHGSENKKVRSVKYTFFMEVD